MQRITVRKMAVIIVTIAVLTVGLLSTQSLFAGGSDQLTVSHSNIKLGFDGVSEFITVKVTSNGKTTDVTKEAVYTTSNEKFVTAVEGRIFAENKGTATVTVSYQGMKQNINVEVLEFRNVQQIAKQAVQKRISELNASASVSTSAVSSYALTSNDRAAILARAESMLTQKWTPKKNLTGYGGSITFKAGTTYTGLPYSQGVQKNAEGFMTAMGYSDFYLNTTSGTGKTQPRYGNDCSGYVSFAWGISRNTTKSFYNGILNGTYKKLGVYDPENPTGTALRQSYPSLEPADAVVSTFDGHMFLVVGNYSYYTDPYCLCYEQTPPQLKVSVWYYSKLSGTGYMPFGKY